jgi:hypothetical protein
MFFRPVADVGAKGSKALVARHNTDFSLSLEKLTGLIEGNPEDAPTEMIADIQRSWKKPMEKLSDTEIGDLIVQHYGYPFVLDLVWPKLLADPLFDGGHYPGDVLSMLIRADPRVWAERPDFKADLAVLYRQALARPNDENDTFRESLGLLGSGSTH